MEFALGDEVKDRITGFSGIVIARTEWLNGCWRLMVQSKKLKDGIPTEAQSFDDQQLELIKPKKIKMQTGNKETGGPRPNVKRAADPVK